MQSEKQNIPRVLEYSLLENGLDFMVSGVREVSGAHDQRRLKYGVLHLGAGIELVLKEKLRRFDWKLLFRYPKRIDQQKYLSGDFVSVGLEECIEKLSKYDLAHLSQRSQDALVSFYNRRNRMQHSNFRESKKKIESAGLEVLSIIFRFTSQHFPPSSLSKEELFLLNSFHAGLKNFRRFIRHQKNASAPQLVQWHAKHERLFNCPNCSRPETMKAAGRVECAFCTYSDTAENAAQLYVANVTVRQECSHIYHDFDDVTGEYYELPSDLKYTPATDISSRLHWCPHCKRKTVAEHVNKDCTLGFICFNCGKVFEACCIKCGAPQDLASLTRELCVSCRHPDKASRTARTIA